MSTLLQSEGVCKKYTVAKSEVRVLAGVSLEVRESETVAIVGASGAGKSTLLHILGGLEMPDNGRVIIDGMDVYGAPARRRTWIRATKIGFIFQSYHLLPEMDVLENVMLPAMAGGTLLSSGTEMRRRAMSLLEAVDLHERARHTPMELSGGEQQRVAIARALMNEPRMILADEPTGNLDVATGNRVLEHLLLLTREKQNALVLVTHNEKIAELCDRTLRLKKGRLATSCD